MRDVEPRTVCRNAGRSVRRSLKAAAMMVFATSIAWSGGSALLSRHKACAQEKASSRPFQPREREVLIARLKDNLDRFKTLGNDFSREEARITRDIDAWEAGTSTGRAAKDILALKVPARSQYEKFLQQYVT